MNQYLLQEEMHTIAFLRLQMRIDLYSQFLQGKQLGQVEQANYSLEHRPIQLDEMRNTREARHARKCLP